jgi:tetratricopeptide (TPR) repeat protein
MSTAKFVLTQIIATLFLGNCFQLAWSASPEEIQDHLKAARSYMQAKQWDYASYEWRAVLSAEPGNVTASLGLAEVLNHSGFAEEAIQVLEQSRAMHANPALDLLLAKSYARLPAGHEGLKRALFLFDSILKKTPYHAEALRGLNQLKPKLPPAQQEVLSRQATQIAQEAQKLSIQAFQQGQYTDAADYGEIPFIYSNKVGTINDYALLLFLAGQPQRSKHIFNQLNREREYWRTQANGALASLAIGNSYQAAKEMEQAISYATDPKIKARLYNNLGYIYESGKKRTKARYAYERAIELDPSFNKAQMNLGYIYQREREFDLAVKLFKKMSEQTPQSAEVWNQLGYSYELQNKYPAAKAAYNKAIRLNPNLKDAYYNLGTLYRKMSKPDKASEAFKTMANLEFSELERARQEKTKAGPPQSELFKYIDLFFSDNSPYALPVPSVQLNAEARPK